MLLLEEGVVIVAVETEEASLPWLVPVTTDDDAAWPLILTLPPPPPPPPRRPLGAAQTAKQSLAALQCNYMIVLPSNEGRNSKTPNITGLFF